MLLTGVGDEIGAAMVGVCQMTACTVARTAASTVAAMFGVGAAGTVVAVGSGRALGAAEGDGCPNAELTGADAIDAVWLVTPGSDADEVAPAHPARRNAAQAMATIIFIEHSPRLTQAPALLGHGDAPTCALDAPRARDVN